MKQVWDHAGELHAVVLECEKDELLCENDEIVAASGWQRNGLYVLNIEMKILQ